MVNEDGFRDISGHRVKCQHGPGCRYAREPLNVSSLAKDASKSNVTLIATWFNDYEQYWGHFKCFDRVKLEQLEIAPISISNLQKLVKAIHKVNPNVWVLIMAKYPQTYHHISEPWLLKVNALVKEALEKEPRTLFVDYYMPNDDEGTFYQTAHSGHPNCRGSKLMAHA